jgi:hypothetical protein
VEFAGYLKDEIGMDAVEDLEFLELLDIDVWIREGRLPS